MFINKSSHDTCFLFGLFTLLFFLQYIDQEKHKEAIVAFKMAVNIKNNHVGAWMNHALLLEKSGKRLMREL